MDKYQIFPLRDYDYDEDEEKFFHPEVFRSYILTLPSKSFRGHITALGKELVKLLKALQSDTFIFLGDTTVPWLNQKNDYQPVKLAQAYLTNENVGKRFNGALQVDTVELPTFIRHVAWLIRCNAALPYFHFIDEGQNIVGSICQDGNLHLDALNEGVDNHLKSFIESSRLEYGDKNS